MPLSRIIEKNMGITIITILTRFPIAARALHVT